MSPFPKAIAEVQRQSALQEAVELLDKAEALYRSLQDSDDHLLNIGPSEYNTALREARDAYTSLQQVRYALEVRS